MLDATSQQNQTNVPVEFQGVDFSVDKKKLIFNVNCKLDQADITVVMGANGAGKSLFLRLIAGLLKPDIGQVLINAKSSVSNHDACVSIVFQNPVLLRRSAFENLAYVLKLRQHSKKVIKQKVQNALVAARLEKQALTPARRLSGGEQQRLAMARALVVEPDILLLDEATANLDPASTFIVEKMVDEASGKGTTIVFVTHDVRQAKRIGDKVLFLHEGQVLAHKPAQEFFRSPGSHEAQAYLDGRVPN